MSRIKLKEYCDRNSISYNTGYRWFKEGKLPVKAFQLETGTILVEDELDSAGRAEQPMSGNTQEVISSIVKKTIELSVSNATISDFAAYVLTNFCLTPINKPKDIKVKPEPEDIQTYYSNMIKKTKQPYLPILTTDNSPILSELESELANADFFKKDDNVISKLEREYTGFFKKEAVDPKLADDRDLSVEHMKDLLNKGKKLQDSLRPRIEKLSKPKSHFSLSRDGKQLKYSSIEEAGATGSFKPTEKEVKTATIITADGYTCSDGYVDGS